VEGLAVGIVAVGDDCGVDAGVARDLDARCVADVADHAGDLGWVIVFPGGADQRRHVAAATRDQHADLQLRHSTSPCSTTQSASAVGARSMAPTVCTFSPASVSTLLTRAASPLSTTAIIPSPQLNVRNMSSVGTAPDSRSQRNTAGTFH